MTIRLKRVKRAASSSWTAECTWLSESEPPPLSSPWHQLLVHGGFFCNRRLRVLTLSFRRLLHPRLLAGHEGPNMNYGSAWHIPRCALAILRRVHSSSSGERHQITQSCLESAGCHLARPSSLPVSDSHSPIFSHDYEGDVSQVSTISKPRNVLTRRNL